MFGPVISQSGRAPGPSASRSLSLATKLPPERASAASTTGCRPPAMRKARVSAISGRVQSPARARSASAAATSISASALAVAPIGPARSRIAARSSAKMRFSISSAWLPALRIFVSISASASVVKRMALAVVWRWTKSSASGGFSMRSACEAGVSMK